MNNGNWIGGFTREQLKRIMTAQADVADRVRKDAQRSIDLMQLEPETVCQVWTLIRVAYLCGTTDGLRAGLEAIGRSK